MGVPDTVSNFLNAKGIEYGVIAHVRSRFSIETAQTAHVPQSRLAKAVLLEDGEEYVLAVVPANRRVDMFEVEQFLHHPVELAVEDDFPSLFRDCRPGAVPPVGQAYGIHTIVDDELSAPPEVFLEAGDHEHLICVSRSDFLTLIEDADHGRISYRA